MAHEKNCEHCGTTFEAKRKDKKYCSSTCRSQATTERKINTAVQQKTTAMSGFNTPMQQPNGNADYLLREKISEQKEVIGELKNEIKELRTEVKTKDETIKRMEIDSIKAQYEKEDSALGNLEQTAEKIGPFMPLVEQLMEKLIPKGQANQLEGLPPMDLATQHRLVDIGVTLSELPEEKQIQLISIMALAYQGQKEKAIELINQTNFTNGTNKAING